MRVGTAIKDPDDTLDYDVDYDRFLPDGDTIQSATATADDGITIESVSVSGNVVKTWVSGGVSGASYVVTVNATSTGGRIKDVCFTLRVRNC